MIIIRVSSCVAQSQCTYRYCRDEQNLGCALKPPKYCLKSLHWVIFFKTSSVWLCLIFSCLLSRAADNRHEDFYGTLSLLPLITQLGSVPLNTITHTYHPDIRQRCFAPQLIRFGNECMILTSSYTHKLTRFSPSTALEG